MFGLFISVIVSTVILSALAVFFTRTDNFAMKFDGGVEPLYMVLGAAFFIIAFFAGYTLHEELYVVFGFRAKFPSYLSDNLLAVAFGIVNGALGAYIYYRAYYVVLLGLVGVLLLDLIF